MFAKKAPKQTFLTAKTNLQISLRPLKKSDSANVIRWLTSSYILQNSFVMLNLRSIPHDFKSDSYAVRYFNRLLNDKKRLTFAVMLDKTHIGNVGLKEIDILRKTAECFIEIGDKEYRAQGFGLEAMKKLLLFAFCTFGLEEVHLDVLEFNTPALKVYHRLGFVSKGQSGWHYDEYGQYWQVLGMSVALKAFAQKNQPLS